MGPCKMLMELGVHFRGLAGLSHLKLNLRNCEALQNVDGLERESNGRF